MNLGTNRATAAVVAVNKRMSTDENEYISADGDLPEIPLLFVVSTPIHFIYLLFTANLFDRTEVA